MIQHHYGTSDVIYARDNQTVTITTITKNTNNKETIVKARQTKTTNKQTETFK